MRQLIILLFIEVVLLKLELEAADTEVPQVIVELRDEFVFMLPVIALAMEFMAMVVLELEVVEEVVFIPEDVELETGETVKAAVVGIDELEATARVCVVADDDEVDPEAEDKVVGAMEVSPDTNKNGCSSKSKRSRRPVPFRGAVEAIVL